MELSSVVAAVIRGAHGRRPVDVRDPDLDDQHLTPARALRELERIRRRHPGRRRAPRPGGHRAHAIQAQALAAFGVDTSTWSRARVA